MKNNKKQKNNKNEKTREIRQVKEARQEENKKVKEEVKDATKEEEKDELKEDVQEKKSDDIEKIEQKKDESIFRNIKEIMGDEKIKFKDRMHFCFAFLMEKPVKSALLLSFIWLIFIEAMSRRSLGSAVTFVYSKFGIFLLNWLIVLVPFLLVLVVTKRIAIYVMASVLWAIVGITDFYMLSYRTTPFTGVDLQLSMNEITVAFEYLGLVKGILISIGIILALLLIVLLFIFSPKAKRKLSLIKNAVIVICSWVLIYLSVLLGIKGGILSTRFSNLGIAYHDYGIAYCLTITIVDTGISEPKDYSEEKIGNLVKEENSNTDTKQHPNIIFLQLESFIDPEKIKGVTYSQDPIPYYRELREKYSSGYLTVPTVVAGTCNTEFEVITGMSLEFFGPGEYPYKTILKETTCESMAYDLKNIGYTAHAIHNHTSSFYGRNDVYANMGFDTFTGIEMMHDFTRTASDRWAKDNVLTGCIMDCLESTESNDLIYTVSVQCHGVYTLTLPENEKVIDVSGIDDEELANSYTYYVNMEKQVDDFIKELTTQLENYDEDVVLVMYGDHIPGLSLSDDSFDDKTIYETEYVIWDNMGLEKKNENVKSYQLAADVFDRVDIHEGTIFKYHQSCSDKTTEEYSENLLQLQYDLLYGNRYAYGGESPYERTDIKYGTKKITIDKVNYNENGLYIEGGAFNEFTRIYINDEEYIPSVISSSLVKVEIQKEELDDNITIVAKQMSSADDLYYETEEFNYKVR